jgi:3-deoxy-7-phosphoheptulonate synthase
MIIVMAPWATPEHIDNVKNRLGTMGFQTHLCMSDVRTILGVIDEDRKLSDKALESWAGVERVIPVVHPFKLASREFLPDSSRITVGNIPGTETPVVFGGDEIQIIAGPCALEDEETTFAIARALKKAGCTMMRGGAFKPRTSPYSFQGMGQEGLNLLKKMRRQIGLLVVTEAMDITDLDAVAEAADIVQIGTRNMSNFPLLKKLGTIKKPILLKRGMSSTIKEFLMAAEYILAAGNFNVILCERGIRTFEDYTRFTLDINAVPAIKHLSHLPIIVDPSHGTGKWRLVEAVACAGIAAGADGLIIEVHPSPEHAHSDGCQALLPEKFPPLLKKLQGIAKVLGRKVAKS